MPPPLAISRIGEHVGRAISENQPASWVVSQPFRLRHLPCADDTGHRVAIGKADGRKSQELGRDHQFFRSGGPAQEREVRLDAEFGIAGCDDHVHAKTPCRNQRGTACVL